MGEAAEGIHFKKKGLELTQRALRAREDAKVADETAHIGHNICKGRIDNESVRQVAEAFLREEGQED